MSKPVKNSAVNIPDHLLKDLLTTSEIRMLKNRFQIINLLDEGLSIRKIAEKVRVGTDTVVRIIRMADKNGLKSKLKKKEIKSSTPWIFGKSND